MRKYIVNERIRARQVRLIDENGKQQGIVPYPTALAQARERGLDLILIAAGETPVCRIADHGKLKYEESKKEREARKGQRGGTLKEVKVSPKIAQHDFDVRLNKARELLEKRHKVKVSMFFRGREMAHVDLGMKVMDRIIQGVEDLGKPESSPKRFGKNFIIIIAPK